MTGRTSWWPKDAAWHRRELIVELGDEFGAEGPFLIDVLSAWAQEQRAGGEVRGGFRTLAREAFVTVGHAESILVRAGEIGALDDVDLDSDGRRFRCRVSGWRADQERGRAAVRQADRRNSEKQESPSVTPGHAESRSVTPSALPNQNRQDQEKEQAPEAPRSRARQLPDSRVLEVECPECGAPAGAECLAARGGTRPSKHLKRHHLVGELMHMGGGRTAKKPPADTRRSAAAVAGDDQRLKARAEFCAHFPDIPPAVVMNAARQVGRSVDSVREYLESVAAA